MSRELCRLERQKSLSDALNTDEKLTRKAGFTDWAAHTL